MIDFQNGGLESEVYTLISKMCEITESDDFPKFLTTQEESGRWKCPLEIPGVKNTALGYGETEAKSINACAYKMLLILEKYHQNNEYDPDIEESLFKDRIEVYFGDIKYSKEYNYYIYSCGLDFDDQYGYQIKDLLMRYVEDNLDRVKADGGEVVKMSDLVDLRFLVRRRKKNYA